MRPFTCTHCGNTVFFENSPTAPVAARRWASCRTSSAWSPSCPCAGGGGSALGERAGEPGTPLRPPAPTGCQHALCNWMVDTGIDGALCASCRLNLTVPDPAVAGHLARWTAIESAKRRLVYGARPTGVCRLVPKVDAGDTQGLGFRVLGPPRPRPDPVVTGHVDGVVTLNLLEADDVHPRDRGGPASRSPGRTVLGHLRHEFAHYLSSTAGSPAMRRSACHAGARPSAMKGPTMHRPCRPTTRRAHPAGWEAQHVSAYATAHPRTRDWAETCAHLLLIVDALETAHAWGLQLERPGGAGRAAGADAGGGVDRCAWCCSSGCRWRSA